MTKVFVEQPLALPGSARKWISPGGRKGQTMWISFVVVDFRYLLILFFKSFFLS